MDVDRVGLVVVSHSRALAQAAVSLAGEMVAGTAVRIELAAGLDETTFGTDAVAIKEAIERADGPAGVVVLMDLGSAVLSADLALDLLDDPTARDRVTLSPAPVVEGLIVAAVAAAGGASRAEVADEAANALAGKQSQLASPDDGAPGPAAGAPDPAGTPGGETVGVFVVSNPHGLHARPAARLVAEVRGLDAAVELRNLTTGGAPVPAGSLSRVATLGALKGHQVEIRASGARASEAVEQLLALAARHFDESVVEPDVAQQAAAAATTARGPLPASAGIAIGPVRHLGAASIELPSESDEAALGGPAQQWQRVEQAVADARRQIEQVRSRTAREVGDAEASIFDAHLSLLSDAEILTEVRRRVDGGAGAAAAWAATLADVEQQWASLPDPYLRERAADVRAVSTEVLRALTGASAEQTMAPGVLVARDLTPAEAAGLDAAVVAGVVLAQGSSTSHAVILARARSIPMVVAAGVEVLDVTEGTAVVLDGATGELHIDPAQEVLDDFSRRADVLARRRTHDLELAQQPAVSLDGTPFAVLGNVGSVGDAEAARASGADGAGLVRTEFLFLDRDDAPDVDEQQAQYEGIAEALGGRRVTLRSLDVGGDKPLGYLPMPPEQNPYLGRRGIRLSLEQRPLLHDQLVAVCQTARRHPTSLMFPMVSTLDELLAAREVLVEAAGQEGLPSGLQVGMMVEVPAAALKIETFLPHLDFVSIGTNDLTQYTLAAERGNAAVAELSDALDPAVLQLIDRVCRAAAGQVDVSVCGEVAADELAIPVLVGLGVRTLSVAPTAVPAVKSVLRALEVAGCGSLAEEALTLANADAVRSLVRRRLNSLSE